MVEPLKIGFHNAVYDDRGILRSWTRWHDAIEREMHWYERCPLDNGYPRFVTLTFMDGQYQRNTRRPDMIPAMQNGMGILSYLKYYQWTGRKRPQSLKTACAMGDYLVKEANTPNEGVCPRFTRSTGRAGAFPQPPDCGSQADRPYEIEPDKGGLAGYALLELFLVTRDERYRAQALQNARVLVQVMRDGSTERSPYPFRIDYRTGEGRGEVSANMGYILRLFDGLLAQGFTEFNTPRERLFAWIRECQIPSATKDGKLWVNFHEDYDLATNRNSWSALNLARYLVEKREALDPDWQRNAQTLIEFVNAHFTSLWNGIPVCGEQDDDKSPWGGSLSNYGGVLALYSAATKTATYKGLAYQALTFCLYATDTDGCPGQNALRAMRGGWQEDAHTDKIHNLVDALIAFPEWGR